MPALLCGKLRLRVAWVNPHSSPSLPHGRGLSIAHLSAASSLAGCSGHPAWPSFCHALSLPVARRDAPRARRGAGAYARQQYQTRHALLRVVLPNPESACWTVRAHGSKAAHGAGQQAQAFEVTSPFATAAPLGSALSLCWIREREGRLGFSFDVAVLLCFSASSVAICFFLSLFAALLSLRISSNVWPNLPPSCGIACLRGAQSSPVTDSSQLVWPGLPIARQASTCIAPPRCIPTNPQCHTPTSS